jgi:hypothetical protein
MTGNQLEFLKSIRDLLKRGNGLRYIKNSPRKRTRLKAEPQPRVGVTRKDKKQSKARRKMAKESRRINRGQR